MKNDKNDPKLIEIEDDLFDKLFDLTTGLKLIKVEDVFKFAMWMEKKSEAIYAHLSNAVKNPRMQELFSFLSQEEAKHFIIYEEKYYNVQHIIAHDNVPSDLKGLMVYMKDKVFTQDALGKRLKTIKDVETVYEFGISMELDQMLFFQEIRGMIREAEVAFIDEMINEERKHFNRLMFMKNAKNE